MLFLTQSPPMRACAHLIPNLTKVLECGKSAILYPKITNIFGYTLNREGQFLKSIRREGAVSTITRTLHAEPRSCSN